MILSPTSLTLLLGGGFAAIIIAVLIASMFTDRG